MILFYTRASSGVINLLTYLYMYIVVCQRVKRVQLLYAKGQTLLCLVLSFFCQNISLVALNAINLSVPVGDCRCNAWVTSFSKVKGAIRLFPLWRL